MQKKYTIKGLTEATLAINSLNITLRGYSSQKGSYPLNEVKHVVIDTQEAQREVEVLKDMGLIELVPEQLVIDDDQGEDPVSSETNTDPESQQEDSQQEDAFDKEARNIGIDDNGEEPEKEIEKADETEDKPVVMTEDGTAKANHFVLEAEESERTRESLEAMEQLEQEEREAEEGWEEQTFIDRQASLPDEMGQDTIVATGNKETQKRKMVNNAIDHVPSKQGDSVVHDPSNNTGEEDQNSSFIEI